MRPEEMELDQPQQARAERASTSTAVAPDEILEEVTWRVAVPIAEGNFPQAFRQLKELHVKLHGIGVCDPLDDPISCWIDDDVLCGHLNKNGIFTMLELMEQPPVHYLSFNMLNEGSVRKIAIAQARCRKQL